MIRSSFFGICNRILFYSAICLCKSLSIRLLGNGNAVHIGASGVIFGLIGFLMSVGVFRREWTALVISATVLVLYGGAVQSLLTYRPGISWSGHLFGFISGILAAWWTKKEKS